MSKEEFEHIKSQVLKTKMDEIRKHQNNHEDIEFIDGELSLPEILQRQTFRIIAKIQNWTVCLVKNALKPNTITIVLVLSLLLDQFPFRFAQQKDINQIRYEISIPKPWADPYRPIVNGFVILPPIENPQPHTLEENFLEKPQSSYIIAPLTGLSPQVSGHYLYNS